HAWTEDRAPRGQLGYPLTRTGTPAAGRASWRGGGGVPPARPPQAPRAPAASGGTLRPTGRAWTEDRERRRHPAAATPPRSSRPHPPSRPRQRSPRAGFGGTVSTSFGKKSAM